MGIEPLDERRPERRHHLALVIREDGRQLRELVRAQRRQLVLLWWDHSPGREAEVLRTLGDLQLPIAGQDRAVFTAPPEDRVPRSARRLAADALHEIDAVDHAITGSAAPAAPAAVAKMSTCATGESNRVPAGSCAGHLAKKGVRTPPSKKVIFQPR